MEKKYTYCRICEAACGFVAEVENNRIVKYYPDKDHPVSAGYCCIKGTRFLEKQYHQKRVKFPLKKLNGRFERISWDQAVDEIVSKLLQIKAQWGPDAIATYIGNPSAFSYSMGMYAGAFIKSLGTKNRFGSGSQDCNNKFAHSQRFYGSQVSIIVPDFENIDCFLALGTNPAASNFSFVVFPHPLKRLKEMENRGCKIVWVNPRKTEAAHQIGEHLFIRPNTDIFLIMAMIHYVLENDLYDKPFVEAHSKGIDNLKTIVRKFGANLDKVQSITGISKEKIIEITNDFLNASKKGGASVYSRVGTDRGPFSTLFVWAVDVFNFITGNVDKKGNFYSYGMFERQKPKPAPEAKQTRTPAQSRIGKFLPVIGSYPAAIMADEIMTPGEGQIRAMMVMAGDPLVTCPNAKRLEKALKSLELLFSIDMFVNDTGCLADYILPVTTFLEREDLAMATMRFNPIPFANYSQAVVQPEDETKHEWEIFSMMGEKAGFPIFTGHPADLFKMMLKDNDQIKYKELVSSEKGIFYTDDKKLKYNQLLPDCIAFPDQLIPLVPQDYEEELKKLEQYDFSQNPDYPYSLISGRQIETINSWIHERLDINHCYINPKDAVKLGIVDGEPVKVSTKIGSIEIEAKITDDLMENVIWIPHGWGRTITDVPDEAVEKNGVNVNLITDDDWTKLETFAGMVMLDGIPVRIEKIQYR